MLFFSHEKEFWRRQFMAERCLHGIPREPDFFHFLVLPSLKYGFLLMDREAFQTPPSPFVPAFQAQAGGRDENGLPSAFKLFPNSCKLSFYSYALGQHLVTWPRLPARKAGILDQAATTKHHRLMAYKQQNCISHSSGGWTSEAGYQHSQTQ